MTNDTRDRMIQTAMSLFRRQGYRATSWRNLVQESGTPWGSVQHHFPGGKEELGVAALELGTDQVDAFIHDCLGHEARVADGVRHWFDLSAKQLAASDFDDGCPIAPIALEMSSTSDDLREACVRALSRWSRTIAEALRGEGMPSADAKELSSTVIWCLEGALIEARVLRSTKPIRQAGESMRNLIVDRQSRSSRQPSTAR